VQFIDCKVFHALWLTDIDNTLLPISIKRDLVHIELLGNFLRDLSYYCILVVPVTFKTLSEIEYISNLMGYEFPIVIVEGGCAIIFNHSFSGQGSAMIELCRGRQTIVKVLEAFDNPCKESVLMLTKQGAEFASKILGIPREEAVRQTIVKVLEAFDNPCKESVLMLTKQGAEFASKILGIPREEAVHALKRRYTELVYSEEPKCINVLTKFVERVGLKVVQSRKVAHLTEALKEDAVKELLKMLLHRIAGPIIASGDSIFDRGFLELADTPIIVSKNAYEWFKRYPYISIWGDIPYDLLNCVSRILLLKPWQANVKF